MSFNVNALELKHFWQFIQLHNHFKKDFTAFNVNFREKHLDGLGPSPYTIVYFLKKTSRFLMLLNVLLKILVVKGLNILPIDNKFNFETIR